jgi:hypothetical protein
LQIIWIVQARIAVEATFAEARLVCRAKLRCLLQRDSGMICGAGFAEA